MNSVLNKTVKEYLEIRYFIYDSYTISRKTYYTVRDAVENIIVVDYEYKNYIRSNIENIHELLYLKSFAPIKQVEKPECTNEFGCTCHC